MREAKGKCEDHYGLINEQKFINRNVDREGLWNKHLQSPVLPLSEALRRVEEWKESDPSMTGKSSAVSGSSLLAIVRCCGTRLAC